MKVRWQCEGCEDARETYSALKGDLSPEAAWMAAEDACTCPPLFEHDEEPA